MNGYNASSGSVIAAADVSAVLKGYDLLCGNEGNDRLRKVTTDLETMRITHTLDTNTLIRKKLPTDCQ
jgi:hypothetical protein